MSFMLTFGRFAFATAILCGGSAYGQLAYNVSLQTTEEPDGKIRYEYLVENLPESTFVVDAFLLDVAAGSDPESITQPTGWISEYAPEQMDLRLGWLGASGFEIPIGGSGTFAFTSAFAPGAPVVDDIQFVIGDFLPDGSDFAAIDFGAIAGPVVPPVTGIPGDYNGNGQVEQADLDLVLLNWGADGTTPPDDWINDLPDGLIDQAELDGVLLNWGNMAALGSAAGVPEPAGWLLVGVFTGGLMVPYALNRGRS